MPARRIVVTVSGMSTDCSFVFMNAPAPMVVKALTGSSANAIVSMAEPLNACSQICMTRAPIYADLRFAAPLNAYGWILETISPVYSAVILFAPASAVSPPTPICVTK